MNEMITVASVVENIGELALRVKGKAHTRT